MLFPLSIPSTMRTLLLAALLTVTAVTAQISMPSYALSNTNAGQCYGFSFRAPTSFTITQLNVPNENSHADQFVVVGRFPAPPTGAVWGFQQLGSFLRQPASAPIPANIQVNQNDEIVILGGCGTAPYWNAWASSLGLGGGSHVTSIGGIPVTLYGARNPNSLFGGAFSAAGGLNGLMGRIDVWINGVGGATAQKIAFGQGCGNQPVPLATDSIGRPVTGTTIQLTVDRIPPTAGLSAMVFGSRAIVPGTDLATIGMPGCFAHVTQDAVVLMVPGGASSTQVPWAVPGVAALAGATIFCQGAAFDPGGGHNPVGAITGNGLELIVGIQ